MKLMILPDTAPGLEDFSVGTSTLQSLQSFGPFAVGNCLNNFQSGSICFEAVHPATWVCLTTFFLTFDSERQVSYLN
jgi:hypothetical protein